jgi:hypothetical protein
MLIIPQNTQGGKYTCPMRLSPSTKTTPDTPALPSVEKRWKGEVPLPMCLQYAVLVYIVCIRYTLIMDDEAKSNLMRIAENTDKIVVAINKPEMLSQKIIHYIGIGASIAGIMSLIDLLKNWFGG